MFIQLMYIFILNESGFCSCILGLFFQSSGVIPSRSCLFPSLILRCFGTYMIKASMMASYFNIRAAFYNFSLNSENIL